jgi:hypothetical protein
VTPAQARVLAEIARLAGPLGWPAWAWWTVVAERLEASGMPPPAPRGHMQPGHQVWRR